MPDKTAKSDEEEKSEKPIPKDNLIETKHSVKIGGKEIKYTVTAGTMILKEESADREKEMKKDLSKFIKDAS